MNEKIAERNETVTSKLSPSPHPSIFDRLPWNEETNALRPANHSSASTLSLQI